MNGKAQVFFFTFMLGITILVLALALAFPVKQAVDTARSNSSGDFSGMNCSSPPDGFYQGACIIEDMTLPYFIIGMIAIGGAVIGAKILFSA